MIEGLFFALVFAGAVGAGVAIAVVLITRPGVMLAFALRIAPPPGRDAIFSAMASRGPYAWLLSGHSWEVLRQNAGTHPEMFPHILLAYRLLGAATLTVFAVIATVTGVMVITR